MATIQDFKGLEFPLNDNPLQRKWYNYNNVEYATSSHQSDHHMFPNLIAFPDDDEDIQTAVKYAKSHGYAVAVMTGGHQYSGACSTHGTGIQLNLRETYKGPNDLVVLPPLAAPNSDRPLVYASVSQSLGDLNKFLRAKQLFVPHGQCTDVHLGGHAQTGGYGQLGRSFGLLGDHIRGIRMINYDGDVQEVTKASNAELFYAMLGGSPGNFGIITHYTIEVYRDADYWFPETDARPRGLKSLWLYSRLVVQKLLDEVAVMADDLEFPRNFDLTVSILGTEFPIFSLIPELKEEEFFGRTVELIDDTFKKNAGIKMPALVVLYAQWVPMNAEDRYTSKVDAWFQKFKELEQLYYVHLWSNVFVERMSQMTGRWLFDKPREFEHPYDKRPYMTNSTTLVQNKWVPQLAERIDRVVNPSSGLHRELWLHCFLSVRLQVYGGKHSQYFVNRKNGTSYSWRDSTVCQTLDCFYSGGETGKVVAAGWQAGNDELMVGANSPYSKRDKRVLWASYGDWVMDNSWPFYYENEVKYERIGRQRTLADPNGTFTPNPFNVKAVKYGDNMLKTVIHVREEPTVHLLP